MLSITRYLPSVPIAQYLPSFPVSHFLPLVPNGFYSSVGSALVAVAAGGAYGWAVSVLYPQAQIFPLHYAAWFGIAFQIKEMVLAGEKKFEHFLGSHSYLERLEKTLEKEVKLYDLARYYCWQVIQFKSQCLRSIDHIISRVLKIRPYKEILSKNVKDASFLEMCRYRIWPVFKMTILDMASFEVSCHLLKSVAIYLPSHTGVPFLLIIRSIVKDILLVPALHVCVRFCRQIADALEMQDGIVFAYRPKWIHWCLPSL